MKEYKETKLSTESFAPKEEKEINRVNFLPEEIIQNPDILNHNSLEKNQSEIAQIEEIRNKIDKINDNFVAKNIPKEIEKDTNKEIEIIDGKTYNIFYVPKQEIYPAFGYGGGDSAIIREDLSPRIKKFVKAHELYHCTDKSKWGGWIGGELRANFIPGLKNPLGLIATIWKTISDKDRINFYLKRAKEGF